MQRPLSTCSQASTVNTTHNTSAPKVPGTKPCRNNYLYFNYNNNKMNYLNAEPNNTTCLSNNMNGEFF